jgi:hypothetical protein
MAALYPPGSRAAREVHRLVQTTSVRREEKEKDMYIHTYIHTFTRRKSEEFILNR